MATGFLSRPQVTRLAGLFGVSEQQVKDFINTNRDHIHATVAILNASTSVVYDTDVAAQLGITQAVALNILKLLEVYDLAVQA